MIKFSKLSVVILISLLLLTSCVRVRNTRVHRPFTSVVFQDILVTLEAKSNVYSEDKSFPELEICLKNKGQRIQKLSIKNDLLAKVQIIGNTIDEEISIPLSNYGNNNKIILRRGEEIKFKYLPRVDMVRLCRNKAVKLVVELPFIYTSSLSLILKKDNLE